MKIISHRAVESLRILHHHSLFLMARQTVLTLITVLLILINIKHVCVRADRQVQYSICERLTLPDNLRRTSELIEVIKKIFSPILVRGKSA